MKHFSFPSADDAEGCDDNFFDNDGESEVDDSEIVEWEFDSAIPKWLEKGMLYYKELISEENDDKRIKDSSK